MSHDTPLELVERLRRWAAMWPPGIHSEARETLKEAIDEIVSLRLTRSETAPRVFPVIYWQSKNAKPGPMTIPWEVAEYAYSVYSSQYGRSQSLERLGERGGFHASELDDFVPDWRERASRITQLERELADAKDDTKRLHAEKMELVEKYELPARSAIERKLCTREDCTETRADRVPCEWLECPMRSTDRRSAT